MSSSAIVRELRRLLRYQPSLPDHLATLAQVIVTYLPRKVVRLATTVRSSGMLTVPLYGSVLFADVEGFTTLSERFSQHDPRAGAEEVTDLVNRFLEILITTSQRYGGDLQKFGGDAGLILFTGETPAQAAVATALEVQQQLAERLQEVQTSLGRFPVRVSIGIGTGRMIGVGIGDEVRREWFLSGPPLRRMGEAEALAPSQGIAVDRATVESCGDVVHFSPLMEGYGTVLGMREKPAPIQQPAPLQLPTDEEPAQRIVALLNVLDILTPYLAPGLLSRLAVLTQQLQLWSEHRQVTVMMVAMSDLPDLTVHWGRIKTLRQLVAEPNAFFTRARAIIQQYDGLINKIGISPHGPYLMALFGAPVAHEDEPLRAALAALELQESTGHRLRIGINSGFVFAGDVGTRERREYTVMGDEVNLAHRLMSGCAIGEIWAGPKTASHPALRRQIEGEFTRPQQFKGKRQPIAPFVIRGRRPLFQGIDLSETQIADRRAILQALEAALESAQQDQGQVIILEGEAGAGKSLVAGYIVREASNQGFSAHIGSAPSYGEHLPYAAWEQPMRTLLDLERFDAPPEEAFLKAMEAYGLEKEAPLLAPIIGLNLPLPSSLAPLTAALRERQRRAAMRELWLRASRRCPKLLLLENAQWMPGSTLSLLSAFLEEPFEAPLLILITGRHEGMPTALKHYEGTTHVHTLAFHPFNYEELQELVHYQTGGGETPPALIRWLKKRSNGNPFVASVALRSLISSGVLRRTSDHWQITQPLEEAPVPSTLYGLIQSRIDQLDPPSRHVLRAAAVVGNQMTLAMLNAAYGEEPLPLLRRRLQNLVPLGVVFGDPNGETLVFRQPLTREVALQGLPRRLRTRIHRRLAHYLDQMRGAATSNWLTLLAHHAFEGTLWEMAFQSNLDLGKRAFTNHLTDQAIQALQRAIRAVERGNLEVEMSETYILLGRALTIVGRYEEALEQFARVRETLPQPPTTAEAIETAATLAYHTAETLEKLGRYDEAFAQIEAGLDLPGVRQTLIGAKLTLMQAIIYYRIGQTEKGSKTAKAVIELSDSLEGEEARRVLARALNLLAIGHYRQGNFEPATELGESALQHYRQLHDILGEVRVRSSLLLINLVGGHWEAAEEHGKNALMLARRIRFAEGEAQILANLGEVYRLQGHWEEARNAYQQALALAQAQENTYGIALMENNLAAVAIRQGHFQEAHQRLDRAEKLFLEIKSQRMMPELHRHRGRLALLEGNFDEARRWLLQAIEEAQSHQAREEIILSQALLAEVEVARGACPSAQTSLLEAERLLESTSSHYSRGILLLARVNYEVHCGSVEKARLYGEEAKAIFSRLGAEGELHRLNDLLLPISSSDTERISSTLLHR